MRAFLIPFLTAVALLVAAASGFARYASRRYLPQQQMEEALGKQGCVLVLGDSRMYAGLDLPAFHAAAARAGGDRCVANLALGATDISGAFVAAREYFRRGGAPRLAVIGKVGDSLLGPIVPVRPERRVGNDAVHLTWTRPSDVVDEVPGFPWRDVDAFDAGFRFLAARATPFGRYHSLVSARVQQLGVRLTGAASEERNAFGALGDMARLERELRERALARFATIMQGPVADRMGTRFEALVVLLQSQKIPFVVVELPMRLEYRAAVTDKPECAAYQRWLEQALPARGGRLIDLSREGWVDDALFADDLHLGPPGAALLSAELGRSF